VYAGTALQFHAGFFGWQKEHMKAQILKSKLSDVLTAILLVCSSFSFAKGSGISVTTNASVNGTVVHGTVTIANSGSTTVNVTSIVDSLEVRYASGAVVNVGAVSVALPLAIGALDAVTVPFTKSLCELSNYAGAKDMRNVVSVNADKAVRSLSFVPMAQAYNCATCGNGIMEAGEECDSSDACCNTLICKFSTAGTACSDSNACTQTDSCNGAGACIGSNPIVCHPANICQFGATCNPSTGLCAGSSLPNFITCEDGNPCTDNVCMSGACVVTPNAAACEDGNPCTTGDTCVAGLCGSGGPTNCDDNHTCTTDSCDETTIRGCVNTDTAATTCTSCNASTCNSCKTACANNCQSACLAAMFSCIEGSTSTYGAAFCQAEAAPCFASCNTDTTCATACEPGNGCAAGCTP
jgi:hypothetical protein